MLMYTTSDCLETLDKPILDRAPWISLVRVSGDSCMPNTPRCGGYAFWSVRGIFYAQAEIGLLSISETPPCCLHRRNERDLVWNEQLLIVLYCHKRYI